MFILEKKNNILNLFRGILIIIFALFWIYFSYNKTAHFREAGDYIMGYIFPIMGIVFILMGVLEINSYLKPKKKKIKRNQIFDDESEKTFSRGKNNRERFEFSHQEFRDNINNLSSNLEKDISSKKYSFDRKEDSSFDYDDFITKDKSFNKEQYANIEDDFSIGKDPSETKYFRPSKKQYKYCPYCGYHLEKAFKYCPECGEKLK